MQILPFSCFDGLIIKSTGLIHWCCSLVVVGLLFFCACVCGIPRNACNTHLENCLARQVTKIRLTRGKKLPDSDSVLNRVGKSLNP